MTHTVAEAEHRERQVVDAAMSHIAEEAPQIAVRGETADGSAGPVLVDAARGADLLVVGSRGLNGVESFLLGSVGAYCAKHASCSLVMVR